jgi:hypothetical protein
MPKASCSGKKSTAGIGAGAFYVFDNRLAKALRIPVACLMAHCLVVAMSHKHSVIKTHDLAP